MARVTRYNTDWLNFNSRSSYDAPIIVNTAGYYDASTAFETFNTVGRDDFYLIYIIDGQLSINIDENEHVIDKGTAIIFPPRYKYKYHGNPPVHYLYVHFTGAYADKFLKDCGFYNLPCVIENEFNIDIQNKLNLLINAFLYNEPLNALKSACLLQEVLIDIRKDDLSKADNSPLKASLKYIHRFFTGKIDIPYLARLENLSNSRYVTVFKKHFKKSPNEYIIDLRLQFAKSLLDNTNMSIRQISESVGYSDQYFFSRLFKKHLGVSPLSYRNNNLI